MRSRLNPLQRDLLEAFFAREDRFFLTGGAALSGFYLGHRTTEDVDLFTSEDLLEDGEAALRAAADALGASIETVRTAPEFRRRVVRRGEEALVVDLVRDRAPQLVRDKSLVGRIRIDPPQEIMANKLCALLSRAEIRDLVDVMLLERSGQDLADALRNAGRKDASVSPAQLGYVLGEIEIGDDARVPGSSVEELRRYLSDLRERLARLAFPSSEGGAPDPPC